MKCKIREAVAVEGRYDAHAVRAAVDTLVIELNGFSVFHNASRRKLLREVAEARGLILLTDSDGAGLLIRTRLRDLLKSDRVRMAYVPAVAGRERRKKKPGRAGILGVEAMDVECIRAALLAAGATVESDETQPAQLTCEPVTRTMLYEQGFFGRPNSVEHRAALLNALGLPPELSVNALIEMLSMPVYAEKYRQYLQNTEETERENGGNPV